MQVSIETTSKLERRLTVGVPAETIDSQVEERLQKARKTVRLPGFRPGKVPLKIMRQRFGNGIREEVMIEVMGQSLQQAIVQEKLLPVDKPTIQMGRELDGGGFEYIATLEVFPEIEVLDIAGFPVEKPVAEVRDEDVDNIIELLRRQHGTWIPVERAAQDGDRVTLDLAATSGGESLADSSAEGEVLTLGSGGMIPGLEDGIVGMTAGEEKTLALNFPEDYYEEERRGAAVEFAVTLHKVEELEPAPLDSELFSAYDVEGDDEALFREEVKQNMARELRSAVEAWVRQQIMDALIGAYAELEAPAALIRQETGRLRKAMFERLGVNAEKKNLNIESILPDELFADKATRRVKMALILSALISHHGLTVDADALRRAVESIASTYQHPEEVVNWYYANQEQLSGVKSQVLENSMLDELLKSATLSDRACTYQEAIALGQQANQYLNR